MKRTYRSTHRVLLVLAVAALASFAASTARAETGTPLTPTSELVDISKQVSDIQRKMSILQATSQYATLGKLAATANCGFPTASQVFLPWGDEASYSLAPQGDISETSDWTLNHTAVTAAHDPFTAGTNSLQLADGHAEAISPAMCVNLDHPTVRLFLKNSGGSGKSDIKVTVLYEDVTGKMQHLTVAKLRAGSDWGPSISIPIGVNILSAVSANGVTAVAFDFKVEGLQRNESYSLDGLYVDPYMSR
jgi:hypothetical protein